MYQNLPVERVYYKINCVEERLIKEVNHYQAKNILVVSTNSLVKTAIFEHLLSLLQKNQCSTKVVTIKQHVQSDSLFEHMDDIKRSKPDLLISCGGGTAIDAAKIISFILSDEVNLEEIFLYSENKREKKITMAKPIPHLAIPTTLSAAEFTSIAGITNVNDHIKYKFSHLELTPKVVFLDPVFTTETPEWLFISTGMRAVDHAVETQYSPKPNPINCTLALNALKKLYYGLMKCKEDPNNLETRLQCQVGAWMSLFSVVNIKLGLSHSIGHQIGALYNVPHGMTSAIMLPHVMEFLLPRTFEEQAQMTEVLEKAEPGMTVEEKAALAPKLIKDLVIDLNIPHRLRDFQVEKESLGQLVENIMIDIGGEGNEFVMDTKDLRGEISKLVEKAW